MFEIPNNDPKYFEGTVSKLNPTQKKAYISFDDGEKKWIPYKDIEYIPDPIDELIREHDQELLETAITSEGTWGKKKQKLNHQQELREDRINSKIEEKKELVNVVRTAEGEKMEISQSSLSLQAMSLAMMGKVFQMLEPPTKDPNSRRRSKGSNQT